MEQTGIGPIVASTQARFRRPVKYPETLAAGAKVISFAADRFSQTGTVQIRGAAMAGHVRSTAPSRIEALPTTGPALLWSCETGRTGGGAIQQRWIVKPGTYWEAAS